MKIVFMGTPDFAVEPLRALIREGHEIALVCTGADKPRGRGYELTPSPVKAAALEYGLEVIHPDFRDAGTVESLRSLKADVFVVVAYGKILPAEVLSIPKFGCVNIHASLLPSYRGAAPIQWAVIDGRKETGITTMVMGEGLDTGDILMQYRTEISPDETGGSLFDRLSVMGGEAITDTLRRLEAGTAERTPQGETDTKYASMLKKEDGRIDWNRPAEETERLIRGLNPWPSAYSFLNGRQLKIWDAEVVSAYAVCGEKKAVLVSDTEREDTGETETGALYQDGSTLYVRCGQDALRLTVIQLEGKKRMEAADFLRGYRFT